MFRRSLRPGRDIFGRKGVFLHITDQGRPHPTPTDPLCLLRCMAHYQLWLYSCGHDTWECHGCGLKIAITPEAEHDLSISADARRHLEKKYRRERIISRLRALRRWGLGLMQRPGM